MNNPTPTAPADAATLAAQKKQYLIKVVNDAIKTEQAALAEVNQKITRHDQEIAATKTLQAQHNAHIAILQAHLADLSKA